MQAGGQAAADEFVADGRGRAAVGSQPERPVEAGRGSVVPGRPGIAATRSCVLPERAGPNRTDDLRQVTGQPGEGTVEARVDV